MAKPENQNIIRQKKDNQTTNNKTEKAFLGIFRKTIETTNVILAGQFSIQNTKAKSARGMTQRIIAKITALTLAIYFNFRAEKPILQIKGLIF